MNMFFWFFESRNKPKDAPLAMWLNGGPGCSSLIGLFQENGPCRVPSGASAPELNPYSWSNYANMLYVDQPIGTGFSYGVDHANSTKKAASYVWKLLQAFYTAFPDYKSREFGLFTESYGGHYGPEFSAYFQQQNAKIDAGKLKGEKINIVALGINNAWTDLSILAKSYVDYGYNNTYKKLISEADYTTLMDQYTNVCAPAAAKCKGLTGHDQECNAAMDVCLDGFYTALNTNDIDVYDIRAPNNDPNPPADFVLYLADPAVMKAIGANSSFQYCSSDANELIVNTGDSKQIP
jgi:carboxypeptidase C (cathepsin A)